jgi:hypothetical protein
MLFSGSRVGNESHADDRLSEAPSVTTFGASSVSQSPRGYSPASSPSQSPQQAHPMDETRGGMSPSVQMGTARLTESEVAKLRKVRQEFQENGRLLEEEREDVLVLAKQSNITRGSLPPASLRRRDSFGELSEAQQALEGYVTGTQHLNFHNHIKRIQTFINKQHRYHPDPIFSQTAVWWLNTNFRGLDPQ